MSPSLPLFIHANRLRVLVIGAGAVGSRRVATLVDAGASVTVVDPEPHHLPPGVTLHRRRFEPSDVEGHHLLIAATNDPATNDLVSRSAGDRLVCRADDADAGEVTFPVAVTSGPITAAVTAGTPALTRRLAVDIQMTIAPAAEQAAALRTLRPTIHAAAPSPAQGKLALADAASPDAADLLARDGADGLRLWLANRHPWLASSLTEQLGVP
jgi:siroheme synthase-like protein